MKITSLFFFLLTISIVVCSCSSQPKNNSTAHKVFFLKGSTNNKLEVLDWGGTGKPVLFLTGIGSTAHVFDDFAPKFTDNFHVYGLTRRGFGASEHTATGYNTKTLMEDLVAILDSLRIDKVILIGHSISGAEVSKFASTHPDRVEKIIYMEGAYDYSFLDTNQMANYQKSTPEYTKADLSSADHVNEHSKKICGYLVSSDELKQIMIFSKDGTYLKDVTPDSIFTTMFKNLEHPDYAHIQCPALAIFATHQTITKFIPFYSSCDSTHKKMLDTYFAWFNRFDNIEMARFKNELPGGTVKIIPDGLHYVFISNPEETEKMIRDFL